MAWLRIELTEDEQRIVLVERQSHPSACVRRRLWAIWLLHSGLKREQEVKILGIACSTVQRDVRTYRSGGLEALRTSGREYRPTRAFQRLVFSSHLRQKVVVRSPLHALASVATTLQTNSPSALGGCPRTGLDLKLPARIALRATVTALRGRGTTTARRGSHASTTSSASVAVLTRPIGIAEQPVAG